MNLILRYVGDGASNGEQVLSLLRGHGITILDIDLPKMILVSGEVGEVEGLLKDQQASDWKAFPKDEKGYRVPDTRRKPKPR